MNVMGRLTGKSSFSTFILLGMRRAVLERVLKMGQIELVKEMQAKGFLSSPGIRLDILPAG